MRAHWTVFLFFAAYHTDTTVYPGEDPDSPSTVGYSWIWYHKEHWMISLILDLFAVIFFVSGAMEEHNWKLSNWIKFEVEEEEEQKQIIN